VLDYVFGYIKPVGK